MQLSFHGKISRPHQVCGNVVYVAMIDGGYFLWGVGLTSLDGHGLAEDHCAECYLCSCRSPGPDAGIYCLESQLPQFLNGIQTPYKIPCGYCKFLNDVLSLGSGKTTLRKTNGLVYHSQSPSLDPRFRILPICRPFWTSFWCWISPRTPADGRVSNHGTIPSMLGRCAGWPRFLQGCLPSWKLLREKTVLPLLSSNRIHIKISKSRGTQRPTWPLHEFQWRQKPGDTQLWICKFFWSLLFVGGMYVSTKMFSCFHGKLSALGLWIWLHSSL